MGEPIKVDPRKNKKKGRQNNVEGIVRLQGREKREEGSAPVNSGVRQAGEK